MKSRAVVRHLAWCTPLESKNPHRHGAVTFSCQRIDFLLPIFNQWTMNKKTYQALAKTRTTVNPELVHINDTGLVVSVTHRDDRDDSLTICRQRIGPIMWSASRVRLYHVPNVYTPQHPSPCPNRTATRAAGSGDGAHQLLLAGLILYW